MYMKKILAFVALVCMSVVALASTPTKPQNSHHMPESFLRSWDSVTLFFDQDQVRTTGPEDQPQRFVDQMPNHPGAWYWLSKNTLQFRPVEAWEPFASYQWRWQGQEIELFTLMEAPTAVEPRAGSDNLLPIDSVVLQFEQQLNVEQLNQALRFELRPLPALDVNTSRWLDPSDYEIKSLARTQSRDPYRFRVSFHQAIDYGQQLTAHLRLSERDDFSQSFQQLQWQTARPFEMTQVSCRGAYLPLSATGSNYSQDQAMACGEGQNQIYLQFSATLGTADIIAARNLVRLTPAVDNLDYQFNGQYLSISGDFAADQLYWLQLTPAALEDNQGRNLHLLQDNQLYFYFKKSQDFLNLQTNGGLMERYGPQMLPIAARGEERLDIRIHSIDPLDLNFWPYPNNSLRLDDQQRPAGPGEEAKDFNQGQGSGIAEKVPSHLVAKHIQELGSPQVSSLVELPYSEQGKPVSYGLELKDLLSNIHGPEQPGTYLVGLRRLNSSSEREWIRVQVTDLVLTTINSKDQVNFLVTSLSSGEVVADADIRIDGLKQNLLQAKTNAEGQYIWTPNYSSRERIQRIVIQKGKDTLVLDPHQPPELYRNNLWRNDGYTWLDWTRNASRQSSHSVQQLCHIFSERPLYKPEESVFIKGYVREFNQGRFSIPTVKRARISISGPGGKNWDYAVDINSHGAFSLEWLEDDLPTGYYSVQMRSENFRTCGGLQIKKEAYREPRFEVTLDGPLKTGLDQAFSVSLLAEYYAGGLVAQAPVDWQVTQFPLTWSPLQEPGYFYSSDARFSRQSGFDSEVSYHSTSTDNSGSSSISIDPSLEATAQARRYVIEATVQGADAQSVSSTYEVSAVPSFTLGLKVPRYLDTVAAIPVAAKVLNPFGELLSGQEVTLRLTQRQWHSYLQAGDFSQGVGQYVTEVVDQTLSEQSWLSSDSEQQITLPISEAGVYLVELESYDMLGRRQSVVVDLFVGGEEPVSWSEPPQAIFKVSTDKPKYNPGETAKLLLQSPFQEAMALAIVEAPNGIRHYDLIEIHNSQAEYQVQVNQMDLPRIPVHFLLWKGRSGQTESHQLDLGKPVSLASSTYVEVSTQANEIEVILEYPKKAQPGQTLNVDIELKDELGQPISGEVTLWLVDQSVLALAEEQAIEFLSYFIPHRDSTISWRDTRNQALGFFPFQEQTGGGMARMAMMESAAADLLDNVTVRKNFKSVPYFNPHIEVNASGQAQVSLTLPDNLTNFKVRAKVVSGSSRFGYHKGQINVRLPVLVQPSLPRFVRPGDSFDAIALARVIDQEGGAGIQQLALEGLQLQVDTDPSFIFDPLLPTVLRFPVKVDELAYDQQGRALRSEVEVKLAVQRQSDQAKDAFALRLPLISDRRLVVERQQVDLSAGEQAEISALEQAWRPGTLSRQLLMSDQPALLQMASGLSYLMRYPHGCTEQRISRASSLLRAAQFDALLLRADASEYRQQQVEQTLEWLSLVRSPQGLISYWPGSRGYVSLSAWTLMFMHEAQLAGYDIDNDLYQTLLNSLQQSLRSDYQQLMIGNAWSERVWALLALNQVGVNTEAWATELARNAQYLPTENLAQVIEILAQSGQVSSSLLEQLYTELWQQVRFELYQDELLYTGLQDRVQTSRLLLPSENRTLAYLLRSSIGAQQSGLGDGNTDYGQVLLQGLVDRATHQGWGDTSANAAASSALSLYLQAIPEQTDSAIELSVQQADQIERLVLNGHSQQWSTADGGPLTLLAGNSNVAPVSAWVQSSYLPLASASEDQPRSEGFVVNREQLYFAERDQAAEKRSLQQGGQTLTYPQGALIEEHIEIVVPEDRHHVALVIPFAAGLEPLNPELATAPAEAKPAGRDSISASYRSFADDSMNYYFDELPKGNYHFYFRMRATIPGSYVQPAAYIEMMYDQAVFGQSAGAAVVVERTTD